MLVITDDFDNMLEVRVRIPFDAMYKAGLIRGYHVLHRGQLRRSIGIPSEIADIDVVWVQRVLARNLLFVVETLGGRFVYDIDDNLLIAPAYQADFNAMTKQTVRTLLHEARVVSSTSNRLLNSLQARSGIALDGKSIVTPNMAEDVNARPTDREPETLLLAMSGHLPLTQSRDGFVAGVKRFLDRRSLPVLYIGTALNDFASLGVDVRATGMLDYFTYREVLRRENALAIVPLEGHGDPTTQEFVDGKSDIKMVEFGSCGIPALYADVGPYRDTPLRCGPLVDMGDEHAVADALDTVFLTASAIVTTGEASVRDHRLAQRCVADTWFKALDAGRLSQPLPLQTLLLQDARYAALGLTPAAQLSILGQRHPETVAVADAPSVTPSVLSPPPIALNGRTSPDHPLFDSGFYVRTYDDVRASGMEPFRHYREHGVSQRRNPNAFFDAEWYVRRHPEAGEPGVDPLDHYVLATQSGDADPSARFSASLYRRLNRDIGSMTPLEHHLRKSRQP